MFKDIIDRLITQSSTLFAVMYLTARTTETTRFSSFVFSSSIKIIFDRIHNLKTFFSLWRLLVNYISG